jgi:predicted transcriptional regulator
MMRQEEIQYLTEKQEKFANLLIKIGMNKNVSKTLVFLADIPEATSLEIEHGTDLRESEVSNGIQYMIKYDWISSRGNKADGKGRPIKIYKLEKSMREIMKVIENDEKELLKKKLALIGKLLEYL